jgi:hypothetical protein
MGCCSPFSAVATAASADPSRHVNFTSGMVLGVDDYCQEFSYHSARDKWIVRDFLGYGTLTGLAVTVEPDGSKGPRVRVTPGAAAAPSGQLICVGREQCGSFNAWLAHEEIKEKVRKLTDGTPDPDHVTLNLYLTLCYVDCAVAEVPIPGEPCRSDENLMAPSRVADDYALCFDFDPPAMAEALAVPALDAFWTGVAFDAAPNTADAFATALRRAELQLRLAFGVYPANAPAPNPADLAQIHVNTAAAARFAAALKRLWVTALRPTVAAQRCGVDGGSAGDCVLLACLTVPVVKVSTHWEVAAPPVGKPTAVTLDESARPVLLSTGIAQSTFGAKVSSTSTDQTIAFLNAPGDILAGIRVAVVRSDVGISVKVPAANAASLGKQLTVKAGGAGAITLTTPPATKIDGANSLALAARGAASLVSDGANTWHVTGLVK